MAKFWLLWKKKNSALWLVLEADGPSATKKIKFIFFDLAAGAASQKKDLKNGTPTS